MRRHQLKVHSTFTRDGVCEERMLSPALTTPGVSGVVVNSACGCVRVCPLAVLHHRDLSHSIPVVYLDLFSHYRRALSPVGIISCQEQLFFYFAECRRQHKTCCSSCTATSSRHTYMCTQMYIVGKRRCGRVQWIVYPHGEERWVFMAVRTHFHAGKVKL